jgi:phage terminase large subunit-like protein
MSHKPMARGSRSGLPRDSAQAGVGQADSDIRMLSGYRVEKRVTGDKVTRAAAIAAQCNIRRIGLLRGCLGRGTDR